MGTLVHAVDAVPVYEPGEQVLVFLERVATPVLTRLLGLPPESVQVVIMTVIRKESGAALLFVSHDPSLAHRFSRHLALSGGALVPV